jgi:hypothetical protein
MAVGVQVWSVTASSNANADTNINWAEGMAPSQVNDSARAEMASVAKWRDDNSGALLTAGSSTAFTVATNQVEGALTAGYTVAVQFHATPDVAATLAVDSLTAKPIQLYAGKALAGSEYQAGQVQRFTYSSTGTGQWIANGYLEPANLAKKYASLNTTDQTLSGGANVTAFNVGTFSAGTSPTTIDFGACPLQYGVNGGNCTITAPSADGSCILMLTNNNSAGALTFSGWTVGPNTGDSISTSTACIFSISMWRINGTASYFIKNLTSST